MVFRITRPRFKRVVTSYGAWGLVLLFPKSSSPADLLCRMGAPEEAAQSYRRACLLSAMKVSDVTLERRLKTLAGALMNLPS
jgi:hypothetical protein